MKIRTMLAGLVLGSFSLSAQAVLVEVTITGQVEYNQIGGGPLSSAVSGDAATMSFMLDSDVFLDSLSFPVRGYEIDQSSFAFTAGSATVGMQDPLVGGFTPYFAIRNDDPAVDGFFTGTNVDGFPNGIPTDSAGIFSQFLANFSVTYGNDPLPSLDILDALGVYDFTGLTVFGFTVDDGPFNAMGLIFEQMTISAVMDAPEPAILWLLVPGLVGVWQVRRRSRS